MNIHFLSIINLLLMIGLASGCSLPGEQPAAKKAKVGKSAIHLAKINSADLAKMVLKPQRSRIDISRDPFKPLINKVSTPLTDDLRIENFTDVSFLGTLRSGDQYLALLSNSSGRGVYRPQDKIRNYTITEIQENELTLTNGIKEIKMKRSVKP